MINKYKFLLMLMMTIFFFGYGQYKHPGLYSTQAQINFVKQQIKDGKEPWKSAFEELIKSNPTARKPNPHVRVPGSSASDGRKDMDAMVMDGSHAHSSALLYALTGEKKYADYAIEVLNAWSIFKNIPMPLYGTWAVPHFINAAELMKHLPGTGWATADRNKFDEMVNKFMWNEVQRPPVNSGSNHACTANEAQFAIAIYLDDQKKFDQAMEDYDWLMKRWIFLADAGIRVRGETANTCRDLSHTRLTIGLMQGCQYAWNQGVDLWKRDQARWVAFAELHAGIMTGDVPAPKKLCAYISEDRAGVVHCNGKDTEPPCQETAWEIMINHISTRLKKDIPIAIKMTERNRPFGKITRRADKWETLMHANQNPANIENVIPPTNDAPTVNITSPANNATFEVGERITLSADADDSDGTINNVNFRINDEFYNYDGKAPFTAGFTPTTPGTYKISAVARDNEELETEVFVTITVFEKNEAPTASFTTPTESVLNEGYSELVVTVDATDPNGDDMTVLLKINGQEIRSESVAPYEWGHAGSPDPSETVGLSVGDHVFDVVVTDAKGLSTTISKTIRVDKITGTSSILNRDALTVFPNPSNSGVFQLKMDSEWVVYNLHGTSINSGSGREIDLSTSPKGIYFLKINEKVAQLIVQ